MENELITYQGKQYKFKELPPEVQALLKDENNNGIPDRLEPNATASKEQKATIEEVQKLGQPQINLEDIKNNKPEHIGLTITKRYLSNSSIFFILTFIGGILILGIFLALGFTN